MIELEKYIKELEIEISFNDIVETRQNLSVLRAQYNKLSTSKALSSLMRLKQTFYNQGEKAGKLLAWCIISLQNERTILEIELEEGTRVINPQEINNVFQ